jgi:hypothetical protein
MMKMLLKMSLPVMRRGYDIETKQQLEESCFILSKENMTGALVSESNAACFSFSIIKAMCIMNSLLKVRQSRFLFCGSETSAECGTKKAT